MIVIIKRIKGVKIDQEGHKTQAMKTSLRE